MLQNLAARGKPSATPYNRRVPQFKHLTLIALLADLILAAAFTLFAGALDFPAVVPCMFPPLQRLLIACVALFGLDLAILPRLGTPNLTSLALILSGIALAAYWIGSYGLSPISFGRTGPGTVSGFRITRPDSAPYVAILGEVVVAPSGSPIEIQPVALPDVAISCYWQSAIGGMFDDPESCDVAYQAPAGTAFDVLDLLARPDCGLPERSLRLKVSILP